MMALSDNYLHYWFDLDTSHLLWLGSGERLWTISVLLVVDNSLNSLSRQTNRPNTDFSLGSEAKLWENRQIVRFSLADQKSCAADVRKITSCRCTCSLQNFTLGQDFPPTSHSPQLALYKLWFKGKTDAHTFHSATIMEEKFATKMLRTATQTSKLKNLKTLWRHPNLSPAVRFSTV